MNIIIISLKMYVITYGYYQNGEMILFRHAVRGETTDGTAGRERQELGVERERITSKT